MRNLIRWTVLFITPLLLASAVIFGGAPFCLQAQTQTISPPRGNTGTWTIEGLAPINSILPLDKKYKWIRHRYRGDAWCWPDRSGANVCDMSGEDIDVSADGKKWLHVIGEICLDNIRSLKDK